MKQKLQIDKRVSLTLGGIHLTLIASPKLKALHYETRGFPPKHKG